MKEDRESEVADLPEEKEQKTNRKDCAQFQGQNWERTSALLALNLGRLNSPTAISSRGRNSCHCF